MARGYRFGVVGSISTVPNGKTVLPTDDITIWLKCASIKDKAYTTLAQVLADSTTLQALISSNNAVDYMVRSTTWASGVTADSGAMTLIGANNYASNTLLSDSTWINAICNSTYFESVLNVKVPIMTGYTTPEGEVIYTSSIASDPAWRAFDRNIGDSGMYVSSNVAGRIGYKFDSAVKIYYIDLQSHAQNYHSTFVVQSSDDNVTYTDKSANITNTTPGTSYNSVVSPGNASQYWAVYGIGGNNGAKYMRTLQFYGRQDV